VVFWRRCEAIVTIRRDSLSPLSSSFIHHVLILLFAFGLVLRSFKMHGMSGGRGVGGFFRSFTTALNVLLGKRGLIFCYDFHYMTNGDESYAGHLICFSSLYGHSHQDSNGCFVGYHPILVCRSMGTRRLRSSLLRCEVP